MGLKQWQVHRGMLVWALLLVCSLADPFSDVKDLLVASTKQEVPGAWLHQAHAKQHGCLSGFLTPYPQAPSAPTYAGIFTNHSVSFPLFMRFSNGAGHAFIDPSKSANQSDCTLDSRGVGLKIFSNDFGDGRPFGSTVLGTNGTIDFTFRSARRFFLNDAPTAADFFRAVQQGGLKTFFLKHPVLATLFARTGASGVTDSMMTHAFFSPMVNAIGSKVAARFAVYPKGSPPNLAKLDQMEKELEDRCPISPDIAYEVMETNPLEACPFLQRSRGHRLRSQLVCPGAPFNYLRDDLNRRQASDQYFELGAQLYQDEGSTPMDDPTKTWSSPMIPLGEIYLPKQPPMNANQESVCRQLAFNPARQIVAHRPSGWLATMRSMAYYYLANLRHTMHKQNTTEITMRQWLDWHDDKKRSRK